MIISQPTASLRTLSALLYEVDGDPLPSGTAWVAGMTRVSKANGAFANTTNSPTTVSGGADNAFKLELTTTEVNTLGPLRVQIFDAAAGDLIAEYTDEVVTATLAANAITGDVIAASAATKISAAVGARLVEGAHTQDDLQRLLVGVIAGTVSNFTSDTLVFKSLNGAKTRITITRDATGRLTDPTGDLT